MSTPHFIIIGAMKAGTTSLYQALSQSPRLFLPEDKEPDILHRGNTVNECRRLYRRHFRGAPSDALLGEASTMYTMAPWFPSVAEHARDVCGGSLRLLFILRDPIDRIVSHLKHDHATGRLSHTDFDRAVIEEPRYVAISDYAKQLEPWVKAFGASQLHCIRFETFCDHQAKEVARSLEFLGAPPIAEIEPIKANAGESIRLSRINPLAHIARTPLYRSWFRQAIPARVRSRLQAAVLGQRAPIEVRLSAATMEFLRQRFANLPARLLDLTGFEISPRTASVP